MTIEDFKLEIQLLQQKDTVDAFEHRCTTKKEWSEYMCKQNEDKTASAIIDIAERYDIPIRTVAFIFDPSMLKRISRLLQKKQENIKIK